MIQSCQEKRTHGRRGLASKHIYFYDPKRFEAARDIHLCHASNDSSRYSNAVLLKVIAKNTNARSFNARHEGRSTRRHRMLHTYVLERIHATELKLLEFVR